MLIDTDAIRLYSSSSMISLGQFLQGIRLIVLAGAPVSIQKVERTQTADGLVGRQADGDSICGRLIRWNSKAASV